MREYSDHSPEALAVFLQSAIQTQIHKQAACLGFQFVLGLPIRERNAAEWREDKGIWASNFTHRRSKSRRNTYDKMTKQGRHESWVKKDIHTIGSRKFAFPEFRQPPMKGNWRNNRKVHLQSSIIHDRQQIHYARNINIIVVRRHFFAHLTHPKMGR